LKKRRRVLYIILKLNNAQNSFSFVREGGSAFGGDGLVILLFIHVLNKNEPFIAKITLNSSVNLNN
jgi:hypothetical protein